MIQYNLAMRIGLVTVMASFSMLMLGCSGRARVSEESGRLRGEIVELQGRVDQLERRNRELELELQRASAASDSLPEEVRAAAPHVTEIKIQRLSFARDRDGDGVADLLTLYIAPSDGFGRFTQLVGELAASAMLLPAQSEPRVVGQVSLSPVQVRDAYRSGITGTHYTIEVPLALTHSPSSAASEREVFARVQYRDALTGQTLTAEGKIALPQGGLERED